MSFILLSGIKTVSHTFEGTTQNIALSVLLTMPIVGGVPYPYLLRYLSDTFEIHLTFLIVGCLIGITMPITLTWYIPKQRQNIMETQQEVPNRENDIHENGEPSVNRYETMDAVPDEDTNNATTENVITTIELSCDNRVFSHMITSNKDDPDGQNIDTRRNTSQQIMTTQPLKTRETKNWRMILKILLTNVPFVLFVFGHAFASSSLRVLATILTDVLRDRGLTSTETTVALMIYNFSGIPGRLLVGLVKKIPRGSSFILVVALTVFATPALIGLCFVNNMGSSAILCSLCGLAFGAVHASNGVTVPSLVGTDDSTPAIGLSWGVTGIFIAITGPLGGEYCFIVAIRQLLNKRNKV